MIKKPNTEMYVGVAVWLLTVAIAWNFWATGYADIKFPYSPPYVAAAFVFFLIFAAGYLLSHGVVGNHLTRRHKMVGLAVSFLASAVLSVSFFFFGMMGCMMMMLIIQFATLIEQKWAILVAVTIPALFVTVDFWLGKEVEYTNVVVFSIINALALITSYRAIAERDAKLKSEQLVRELKATQILLSATTKRDERLRISRNLHDILGHQLTALNLQLEVASHVDNDQSKEHVANARRIGTTLLSNVRETVSEFREERDLELYEALSALIEGIPNLEINLTVDWDEKLATERQVEVLFRSCQEALTNVVKHSDASRCDITVSSDEQNIVLVVRDNGSTTVEVEPGNGLNGMSERVSRIDGEMSYQSHSDGFVLLIKLPVSGA